MTTFSRLLSNLVLKTLVLINLALKTLALINLALKTLASINLALMLFVLLFFSSFSTADDYNRESDLLTDIYRPSNVTTDKLKTVLKPLYKNSLFSTDGQQLIIRAKPSTMNEILSLLLQLDHPARTFSVQLSNHMENTTQANVYSTAGRSAYLQHFTISENSTLIVAKERQTQQLSEFSSDWLRVDTEPAQGEYLTLDLHTSESYVYLTLQQQTLRGGVYQTVNQQVGGPIGQWLVINGEVNSHGNFGTRIRSNRQDRNLPLFIKINPIN